MSDKFKNKLASFTDDFFVYARTAILKYREFKELTGEQKKDRVDSYMTDLVLKSVDTVAYPIFFKWVVKTFVIKLIPVITQRIYDLIKDNVEGITNK